jgi:hypothetical protein
MAGVGGIASLAAYTLDQRWECQTVTPSTRSSLQRWTGSGRAQVERRRLSKTSQSRAGDAAIDRDGLSGVRSTSMRNGQPMLGGCNVRTSQSDGALG